MSTELPNSDTEQLSGIGVVGVVVEDLLDVLVAAIDAAVCETLLLVSVPVLAVPVIVGVDGAVKDAVALVVLVVDVVVPVLVPVAEEVEPVELIVDVIDVVLVIRRLGKLL